MERGHEEHDEKRFWDFRGMVMQLHKAIWKHNTKDSSVFTPLTPRKADISPYHEAIDYVFNNRDIQNVAISGMYGSGKSSVLKALKEDKSLKKHRYLEISLAKFGEEKHLVQGKSAEVQSDGNTGLEGQNVTKILDCRGNQDLNAEKILEGKILNQIIHKVKRSRVPKSGFGRLHNESRLCIGLKAFGSTIFIMLLIAEVRGLVPDRVLEFSRFHTSYESVCRALLGISIFVLLSVLFRNTSWKRLFRRLKIQGAEIELFDGDNLPFDKHMNELLYLLKGSKCDVIVFEDLDRYCSVDIFRQLREIVSLLNCEKFLPPIRFFYLMRDDMLPYLDRTKFFDFVIPVIPYADPSNADAVLSGYLECAGHKFEKRFISELSLFIDDARTLACISNEYSIYKNAVNTSNGEFTSEDEEKLLSLIVYKNLLPSDFSRLQCDQGYLWALLQKRKELVDKLTAIEIDKKSEVNGESVRENEDSEKLLSEIPQMSLSELLHMDEANLDEFFTLREAECVHPKGGNSKSERIVDSERHLPFIRYLILSGKVDYSYHKYMSIFHDGALSNKDHSFILSVLGGNVCDCEYELDEPSEVLNQLGIEYLGWRSCRAFSLTKEILAQGDDSQIETFIRSIRNLDDLEYIAAFASSAYYDLHIFPAIRKFRQSIVETIASTSAIAQEKRRTFLQRFVADGLGYWDVSEVGRDIRSSISNDSDFLDFKEIDCQLIETNLQKIEISFEDVNLEMANTELLEFVYQNWLFEPRASLYAKLTACFDNKNENEVYTKLFESLLAAKDAVGKRHPENYLQALLSSALEDVNYLPSDKEEFAGMLLRDKELSLPDRVEYAGRHQKRSFCTFIQGLATEIIGELLDNDVYIGNMPVIIGAFQINDDSIRHCLEGFINRTKAGYFERDSLDEAGLGNEDFCLDIVRSKVIKMEIKNQVLCKLKPEYCSLEDAYNLEVEQINMLVGQNCVSLSEENIAYLRKHLEKLPIIAIEQRINEYIEQIVDEDSAVLLIKEELINILDSDSINMDNKLLLLENFDEAIPISISYKEELLVPIIDNHFSKDDIKSIVKMYETALEELKYTIFRRCVELGKEDINLIIGCSIPYVLVIRILEFGEIPMKHKVLLILRFLQGNSSLERGTAEKLLNAGGLSDIAWVVSQKRAKKIVIKEPEENEVIGILRQMEFVGKLSVNTQMLHPCSKG